MRSYIALLLASLGGFAISSPAQAVFIDFETLPGGGVITPEVVLSTQYSSLGVTFSATEDGELVSPTIQSPDVFFGEPAYSGNNYANNQIAGFGPSDGTNRADVFTMSFAGPAFGVSFFVEPHGSQDPLFEAYDAANVLLESIVVDAGDWTLVSFTAGNIARIDGIQPSDSWNYGVDDLSFSIRSVPEPSAVSLLALGLLGLMFGANKRRA